MRLPSVGLSALLLLPRVAGATEVLWVGPAGDFPNLSGAIAAAFEETRIFVEPGVYDECILIDGRNVSIVAVDGPESTTINCASSATAAVHITGAAQVLLDGFTIDNGGGRGILATDSDVVLRSIVMSGLSSASGSGCIDLSNTPTTMWDVNLTGCTGVQGGAIRFNAPGFGLTIRASTIDDGAASGDGGGIWFTGSLLEITGTTISNSSSGTNGGGAWINGSAQAQLTDLEITGSTAARGAGLYAQTPVRLVDPTILNNHAIYNAASFSGGEGGAIYSSAGGTAVAIVRGTLSDNLGDHHGGAITADIGTVDLLGTTLERNIAGSPSQGGYGGAVAASRAVTNGTEFRDNAAYLSTGGAIYAPTGWTGRDDVFVGNGKVSGTTVTAAAGAVYAPVADIRWTRFTGNGATDQGGALYTFGGANIQSVRFVDNTAGIGGAMHLYGTGNSVSGSVFTNNSASTGGALYMLASGQVSISGSTFEENDAVAPGAGDGGAIYQLGNTATPDESISISNTLFRANTATRDGGAIYATRGVFSMHHSWLNQNQAGGRGGAAFLALQNTTDVTYDVFCSNDATGNGGGLYTEGQTFQPNVHYTAFVQNDAARGGAIYVDSQTAGYVLYANAVTALANTSTATGCPGAPTTTCFGGITVGPTGRAYVQNSVIQDNSGITGIVTLNTTTSPTSLYMFSNDFEQTNAYLPVNPAPPNPQWAIYDSSNHVGSGQVGDPDKPIPDGDWLPGNCFDDDLTGRWTWQGTTNGVSLEPSMYADQDGDGDAVAQRDCAPFDGFISLDAVEIPLNGEDDDCAFGDETDGDGDGYGSSGSGGKDCEENNASRNPSEVEIVGDGIDQDCDFVDDDDGDNDTISIFEDCDDEDPLLNDLQIEIPYDGPDRNCLDDEYDADSDFGDATAFGGNDCDDTTTTFGPMAYETPYDNVDQNCDGVSDFDADLDGFESAAFGGTDCDDYDPDTKPGGPELPYDGIDQDCAGGNDYDGDGDGFVATAYNAFAGGSAPGLDDCDDANPNTFPGAVEVSDGEDNTCDGVVNPDPDFDSDGVLDWWEGVAGTNAADLDSDDDGLSDGVEWGDDEQDPDDADGDGTPDALETDADADSIPDAIEGLVDSDGDSLENYRDADDDNDQIGTAIETDGKGTDGPDTDDDGVPDWLDVDADDDGALDISEGTADLDEDGIGAWRDDGSTDPTTPTPAETGFCGCSSAPTTASAGWILALVALLGRRRRT